MKVVIIAIKLQIAPSISADIRFRFDVFHALTKDPSYSVITINPPCIQRIAKPNITRFCSLESIHMLSRIIFTFTLTRIFKLLPRRV